jgi:hypothetical protein
MHSPTLRGLWSGCLLITCLTLAGCSGAPPAPAAKKGEEKKKGGESPAPGGTRVVEADKLPALAEDGLEGLDEGRLNVKGPAEWHRALRSDKYLAKFTLSEKGPFPQIIVTKVEAKDEPDLTEDNVATYVEGRQAELVKELKKASIVQDFRAIKLPNVTGAYHVRKSQIENIVVERVIISVVKGGRRYDIETRSLPANIRDYEKFGEAVANGLEFKPAAPAP